MSRLTSDSALFMHNIAVLWLEMPEFAWKPSSMLFWFYFGYIYIYVLSCIIVYMIQFKGFDGFRMKGIRIES